MHCKNNTNERCMTDTNCPSHVTWECDKQSCLPNNFTLHANWNSGNSNPAHQIVLHNLSRIYFFPESLLVDTFWRTVYIPSYIPDTMNSSWILEDNIQKMHNMLLNRKEKRQLKSCLTWSYAYSTRTRFLSTVDVVNKWRVASHCIVRFLCQCPALVLKEASRWG